MAKAKAAPNQSLKPQTSRSEARAGLRLSSSVGPLVGADPFASWTFRLTYLRPSLCDSERERSEVRVVEQAETPPVRPG